MRLSTSPAVANDSVTECPLSARKASAISGSTGLSADALRTCNSAASLAPPTTAAVVDSPIDGMWTTGFTRDEMANSPLLYDTGELGDDNWDYVILTWIFENGQFVAERDSLVTKCPSKFKKNDPGQPAQDSGQSAY